MIRKLRLAEAYVAESDEYIDQATPRTSTGEYKNFKIIDQNIGKVYNCIVFCISTMSDLCLFMIEIWNQSKSEEGIHSCRNVDSF